MRDIIESWQDTDEKLLDHLNADSIQVITNNPHGQPGKFGYRGIAVFNPELAASFVYTLRLAAESMKNAVTGEPPNEVPDMAARAKGEVISGFINILFVDAVGLDLTDSTIRSNITQILTMSNWSPEMIAAILAFGYTMTSIAKQALGRDAVQEDINQIRGAIKEQTRIAKFVADYNTAYNQHVATPRASFNVAETVAGLRAMADTLEGNA